MPYYVLFIRTPIVILGDTCNNDGVRQLSVEADVIVHESTNENQHRDKCVENGHSTPGGCGLVTAVGVVNCMQEWLASSVEMLERVC